MDRRRFLKLTGLGMGTLAVPVSGRVIAAEELLSPGDLAHNAIAWKCVLAQMQVDRGLAVRSGQRRSTLCRLTTPSSPFCR